MNIGWIEIATAVGMGTFLSHSHSACHWGQNSEGK